MIIAIILLYIAGMIATQFVITLMVRHGYVNYDRTGAWMVVIIWPLIMFLSVFSFPVEFKDAKTGRGVSKKKT